MTHKYIAVIILTVFACYAQAQDLVAIETADVVPMDNRITQDTIVTKTQKTAVCTVKVTQHKYSWRFCYDGAVLQVLPFWSAGETTSKKQIVECPTLDAAIAKIEELGLILTKEQAEELAELRAIPVTVDTGR